MNLSETIRKMGQPLEEKMNFSDKEVKMAIGIASDKRYAGGNMTGAVKAIEKMKKGLSDHPQVAAVLKRQNEEVELEEATSGRTSERFQSAEAELIAYAKKSGGMDKGDFMDVAKMLGQIGRLNILQSGQVLSKLNRKLSNMDTDPRDKVYSILKQKGLMEEVEELEESHFKVGDEVKCKDSGMEGKPAQRPTAPWPPTLRPSSRNPRICSRPHRPRSFLRVRASLPRLNRARLARSLFSWLWSRAWATAAGLF